MELQIEKKAPFIDRRKGWGKWQKLLKEMDVGDAVVLEDNEHLAAYHGLRRAAKDMGFKVVMRTLDNGKILVWKRDAEAEAAE